MKTPNRFIAAIALFAVAGSAQAVLIDFKARANALERGYDPLVITEGGVTVTITATATDDDNDQFAYLDSGNAGLGVCKDLTTNNQCAPGSDDNIDASGETLTFVFSTPVALDTLWFNNNHDHDWSLLGDTILLNGAAIPSGGFASGDEDASRGGDVVYQPALGPITSFTIGYSDEQAYVSAMLFFDAPPGQGIPVPTTLALLGLGLAGIGYRQHRSKKAA